MLLSYQCCRKKESLQLNQTYGKHQADLQGSFSRLHQKKKESYCKARVKLKILPGLTMMQYLVLGQKIKYCDICLCTIGTFTRLLNSLVRTVF